MTTDNAATDVVASAAGLPALMAQLHTQLRSYIEAQYPLRHPGLVAERRALLDRPGMLEQEPYIEGMPGYEPGPTYSALELPYTVTDAFEQLAQWEPMPPIPARPYAHQTRALEALVGRDQDLVVVTGTGSGKTETFLLPLLARSILEAAERPASFAQPGMRALLLYPMNALVNDQVTRLRRLIGDQRIAEWLRDEHRAPRPLRFGMYTSRTPYAGQMDSERNKQRLLPLIEDFLRIEQTQPEQVATLRRLGRWPACDLAALRDAALRGDVTIGRNDYELYTRHQIQQWCPDVLVTNYSMLEYMLMRPIERSIFEQTAQWLAQDAANTLLIVLDEAHLYSGATGAEIALLLRRLHARLGIDRGRVRYIVTSASLDPGAGSLAPAEAFVSGLVGVRETFAASFAVVRGQRMPAPSRGTTQTQPTSSDEEAQALARFDLAGFTQRVSDAQGALDAVTTLASEARWPTPTTVESLPAYLAQHLPTLATFHHLWQEIADGAVALSQLADRLFPRTPHDTRMQAASALLTLSAAAMSEDGRPLLPVRAHLFFRGLPPIYACVNPRCTARRAQDDAPAELGALWVTPRLLCECGGRVYELHSHRSCGAVFLCAFAPTEPADFYWHEAGDVPRDRAGDVISQTYLLVGAPHPKSVKDVEQIALHIPTGRVLTRPESHEDIIRVARPLPSTKTARHARRPNRGASRDAESAEAPDDTEPQTRLWRSCPVCRKRLDTPIGSLATKGEQPFVNLVRRQFELQPASAPATDAAPNMGRKVLLFSDGRQRAARLARDLPREVELDTFRQALLLAVAQRGKRIGQTLVKMDHALYREFVAVCAQQRLYFFDGASQEHLLRDIGDLEELYECDVEAAESDGWERTPPEEYRTALLRQVADRLYSMQRMCVAVVEPIPVALKLLKRHDPFSRLTDDDLRAFTLAWIESLLGRSGFDSHIAWSDRQNMVAGDALSLTGRSVDGEKWMDAEESAKELFGFSDADVRVMRERLISELCDRKDDTAYLLPEKLGLRLTLDDSWYRCADCEQTVWLPLRGRCPNPRCGGDRLIRLPGNEPSLRARTDFYREPVRRAIAGSHQPMHLTAEEHTAQLSYRDAQDVSATTERYELRFQDIGITLKQPAIDVLSCTTTMEVGVDIGALLGVGLRTVPPRRANYQQRAGRAGRRGAALATVLTYSENGTHDGHYFAHPDELIAVPAPCPQLSPLNERLLRRHVQAALLQTFFLEHVPATQPNRLSARQYGYLSEALGTASSFFADSGVTSLDAFERWLMRDLQHADAPLAARTSAWLPDSFLGEPLSAADKLELVRQIGTAFVAALRETNMKYAKASASGADRAERVDELDPATTDPKLLDVLLDEGFLPSYAFPRDVRSFVIEEWKRHAQRPERIGIRQRPQQSVDIALSEYAPGRELIVDKQTYRVNGIYVDPFPGATPETRVASVFQEPIPIFQFCPQCEYTRKAHQAGGTERDERASSGARCPLCGGPMRRIEVFDPPGFAPLSAKPLEERQIRNDGSRRSGAVKDVKLVVPTTDADVFENSMAEGRISWSSAEHRELLITNRGPQGEGFSICKSCGAAAPGAATWLTQRHSRPFLTPHWLPPQCAGKDGIWHGALGNVFHSDLLLVRLRWQAGLAYEVAAPWMREACESLAQAMAIAATRMLDISSTELHAGWSYTQAALHVAESSVSRMVDFYLFDTLSGGAGYANQIGARVPELLARMQQVLDDCPESCERSCYRCLRSYENRVLHERLDRKLAGALLRAIVSGDTPTAMSAGEQAAQLAPLARFLELAGIPSSAATMWSGVQAPLLVRAPRGVMAVGVRSVLCDPQVLSHPLVHLPNQARLICSDYQLTRNLPGVAELLGVQ